MCRTVTLTVKSKDLGKVLESLKLSKEFEENTTLTLTVDIEDSKKNYQVLCGSPEVLEWDFVNEEKLEDEVVNNNSSTITDIKDAIKTVKEDLKSKFLWPESIELAAKSVLDCKQSKEILKEYVKSYDDLIELILLSWRLSKKFDKYSVDLVKDYIIPGIIQNKTDISEVSSLDRKIIYLISSYYAGTTTDTAIEDIVEKMQNYWDIIKDINDINSLVTLLFGVNKNKE